MTKIPHVINQPNVTQGRLKKNVKCLGIFNADLSKFSGKCNENPRYTVIEHESYNGIFNNKQNPMPFCDQCLDKNLSKIQKKCDEEIID